MLIICTVSSISVSIFRRYTYSKPILLVNLSFLFWKQSSSCEINSRKLLHYYFFPITSHYSLETVILYNYFESMPQLGFTRLKFVAMASYRQKDFYSCSFHKFLFQKVPYFNTYSWKYLKSIFILKWVLSITLKVWTVRLLLCDCYCVIKLYNYNL